MAVLLVHHRPTVHPGAHGICFLETVSLDGCIAEHSRNPAHDGMLVDSLESNVSTGLGRQDETVTRSPDNPHTLLSGNAGSARARRDNGLPFREGISGV